jgi:protein tyrosine/serine phosphatase
MRILLAIAVASAAFTYAADPRLPNFHKVTDTIYRGAQPSPEGFAELKKLGIATIIDLRESSHAAVESKIVKARGMRYINIPMNGIEAPSNVTIARVLSLINDPGIGPIFIHCKRGADRTGTVLACYRIAHDHWDNAAALAEAKSMGMSGLQIAMQRYVRAYNAAAAAPAETVAGQLP